MAKLTKRQSKLHLEACEKLKSTPLNHDDADFVFTHWHEGAVSDQTFNAAFFTPVSLAHDLTIDIHGDRIVDLCAGIGVLSYYAYHHGYNRYGRPPRDIVCIERNETFVAIGKKLLPEATWICADIFDVDLKALGHFDQAISNPPFGNASRSGAAPRYTGSNFAYHVIDLASDIADSGSFIIPQQDAGFCFSKSQCFGRHPSRGYSAFVEQTQIHLDCGVGIDTNVYADDWKQPVPVLEIACAEFTELDRPRSPVQQELFAIP